MSVVNPSIMVELPVRIKGLNCVHTCENWFTCVHGHDVNIGYCVLIMEDFCWSETEREREGLGMFVMAGVGEFVLCIGGCMGGCDMYVSNTPLVCCWVGDCGCASSVCFFVACVLTWRVRDDAWRCFSCESCILCAISVSVCP